MSKHSPGPWEAFKDEDNEDNLDLVWGTVIDSRRYHVCRIWNDFGKKHEPEANARLIAAAPDLLKALKNVISFYPYTHIDPETPEGCAYQQAKIAIDKAEGK